MHDRTRKLKNDVVALDATNLWIITSFNLFGFLTEKLGYSVDHDCIVKEFHHAFLHENALNPMVFPSLR